MLAETFDVPGRRIEIRMTARVDGDFAVGASDHESLDERRRRIVDRPWTWLRQVHGTDLVDVRVSGEHAGVYADGAITACIGAPIAVTTADCAPVVLVTTRAVAVVHAGWRGALDGIIERAADRLGRYGGEPAGVVLGPCIGTAGYEFGEDDLGLVVDRYGVAARGSTDDGRPALDLVAVVTAACDRSGFPSPSSPPCTSEEAWFSHRTRRDLGRQTTVAWIEDT